MVDGSNKKGFKKWRKTTVHPTYLNKKMTARELLVRTKGIKDRANGKSNNNKGWKHARYTIPAIDALIILVGKVAR